MAPPKNSPVTWAHRKVRKLWGPAGVAYRGQHCCVVGVFVDYPTSGPPPWPIKVRGVCDTFEEAFAQAQREDTP